MKKLFIETRLKNIKIDFSPLDNLIKNKKPKSISLAATIQYLDLIPKIKKYLESKKINVVLKQGAFYKAQVLGCNSNAFDKKADLLLLITDGKFHAINNAIQLQKEIFIFTPNKNSIEKITQEEIKKEIEKIKLKKNKFLNSNTVGLLVSSKHGQHYDNIENIKNKIKQLKKQVYVFQSNNINTDEFENFPQIKIWINTACPGIQRDNNKIINLKDILEFI